METRSGLILNSANPSAEKALPLPIATEGAQPDAGAIAPASAAPPDLVSARSTSTRSRSSATIRAQKLAVEAEHARRLAQIEFDAAETRRRTEIEAARKEYEAKLAQIEANSCRSSRSSRASVSHNNDVERLVDHNNFHPQTKLSANFPTVASLEPIAALTSAFEKMTEKIIQPKVANLSLPYFDGKSPTQWLSFKRVFQDSSSSYSHHQNLARLSYALRGPAREAVDKLLVTAKTPDVVIRALEIRFGRPDLIILQELCLVRSLPKLFNIDRDLITFSSKVNNCTETLRLLDGHDYIKSPELFNTVLQKLPIIMRSRWYDFATAHQYSGQSKLEMLSEFLSHEVEVQAKFGIVDSPAYKTPYCSFDRNTKSERVNKVEADVELEGDLQSSEASSYIESPEPSSSSAKNTSKFSSQQLCLFCKNNSHSVVKCKDFLTLSFDNRWHFVKENKLCQKCLKKGSHDYGKCRAKGVCTKTGCKHKHHELLHNPNFRTVAAHVVEEPSSSGVINNTDNSLQELAAHSTAISDPLHRPLLKVVSVTVAGPSGSVDTFALLDDGSTATFIDAEISAQIGLSGPVRQIDLHCVGGLSRQSEVQYVDFKIKGRKSVNSYDIQQARSISNLGLTRQSTCRYDISKFSYLADIADELCYDAKPTIIIGIDNWQLSVPKATRQGSKTQPVAILTALGWVIFGFASSKTKTVHFVNHVHLGDSSIDTSLENLIKTQYRLDSIGITKHEMRGASDERALKILESTSCRLPNGHFEVGLLWKADNLVVPDSYKLAFSRFLGLEKRFSRDPVYAEKYSRNIRDTLEKGYAEECSASEHTGVRWYLPHFGVVNPNKPGKLRVVNDAAAKSQGVSLNDLLLTGPDLLQSLLNILFRFREEKVALNGDIKEMFPQVKICKADRDAQRFLWRDKPSEPIKTFRMSSMIFGAASSPFTALYVKNKNATEFQDQFPEAARVIIEDHYMDDCITSVDSIDRAARLAADIVTVHRKAGFEMRNWVSNELQALSLLPKDLLLPQTSNSIVDIGITNVRTLGLLWSPKLDTISINTGFNKDFEIPSSLTRRQALAYIMRVYDPLGLVSPVVIRGRALFQSLWRRGTTWDEKIPIDLIPEWCQWFSDIANISDLVFPRRYDLNETEILERELHIFCDASEVAYSAVGYWRFICRNNLIRLALIGSKIRVAPLKPTSIPRLELQAALIATRFAETIIEAHKHKPVRKVFWCDSMTVLGWLRSDARSYKPFVAHRLGEILESTNVDEWRWIPSNLNVADDATRIKGESLTSSSRWVTGPQFLISECDWPTQPKISPNSCRIESKLTAPHLDLHQVSQITTSPLHLPLSADPKRFSSWLRMVRATATAHKFIFLLRVCSLHKKGIAISKLTKLHNCICSFDLSHVSVTALTSRNDFNISKALTAEDLCLAEKHILRQSQIDSFHDEIACVTKQLPLKRRSRLFHLSPQINSDNLLHLSGRIAAVLDVSYETKFPVILDGKHASTRLLIHYYHVRSAHGNTETVVNELRQAYWILSLRSTIRSVTHNCQVCRLNRTRTFDPPMGNLPSARLAHHTRAFTFVGLDYFGPVQVTIGRRREKRYVALYTCLVVRAIHLEIVHSLSADSAIMSLRRFISRRGTPSEIHSDNGTAFVGANRELKSLYNKRVSEFAANERIQWKFIPPSAPFMGGVWERLVKSVKTALRVTIKDRAPKEEVFGTLLAEAEYIINSRPLTHVPADPGSPEGLTPFHFLIGTSSGRSIPASLSDDDLRSRANWRVALRLSDMFWTRWMREYLPCLLPRRSSARPAEPNIKVGDVVLIADGNLPRGTWPRGRVVALFPGRDNIVRVADIQTAAGILRRPLKKLVPIC